MSPAIDDIMQQKLNKLNELRASGIEPFPYGITERTLLWKPFN